MRGIFTFLVIAFFVVLGGSMYVREEVLSLLHNRSLMRSSVIYSMAVPVEIGDDFKGLNLKSRLKNADYREIKGAPNPGQFNMSSKSALIYFKEFLTPEGRLQEPLLAEISSGPDGTVNRILDKKFSKELISVYLEPEVLSYINNQSSRAVEPKPIEDFPPPLVNAVLAIEDERYYSHFGVDPLAIIRALAANVKTGKIVQGGSTITQQLAKNLFLTRDRSYTRKALEAIYAVLLEASFNKSQILELYMNEIFLGQEGNTAIHGFGEAALSFFGKNVEDISIAEAATLAAIIKGPSAYSPRRHPQRAKKRRDLVLKKMHSLGKIGKVELQIELQKAMVTIPPQRTKRLAPYFSSYVGKEVSTFTKSLRRESKSIGVMTTLDPHLQNCANTAVKSGIAGIEKNRKNLKGKGLQAALVAVEPKTGAIRAWVGGRDFGKSQFDRVSQAKRQPGSLFKPIAYLSAFDSSLNDYRVARTTSLLVDEPISLEVQGTGTWEPKNYDKKYRGDVTVREALYKSLNVPTINLAMKAGLHNIVKTAGLLGIKESLIAVPSLPLGAIEVTPLDMLQAYQVIANQGQFIPVGIVRSLVDTSNQELIYERIPNHKQVVDDGAVYVLTDVMRDVIEMGTAASARAKGFTRDAAGKTGTSNDTKDSWFGGFTPSLLAIVWVGFDDNKKTGLTGASGALPIWTDFMSCSLKNTQEDHFVPPSSVVFRKVDLNTGLLLDRWCPNPRPATEVFVKGTEPVTYCRDSFQLSPYQEDEYLPGNEPSTGSGFWGNLWED